MKNNFTAKRSLKCSNEGVHFQDNIQDVCFALATLGVTSDLTLLLFDMESHLLTTRYVMAKLVSRTASTDIHFYGPLS